MNKCLMFIVGFFVFLLMTHEFTAQESKIITLPSPVGWQDENVVSQLTSLVQDNVVFVREESNEDFRSVEIAFLNITYLEDAWQIADNENFLFTDAGMNTQRLVFSADRELLLRWESNNLDELKYIAIVLIPEFFRNGSVRTGGATPNNIFSYYGPDYYGKVFSPIEGIFRFVFPYPPQLISKEEFEANSQNFLIENDTLSLVVVGSDEVLVSAGAKADIGQVLAQILPDDRGNIKIGIQDFVGDKTDWALIPIYVKVK